MSSKSKTKKSQKQALDYEAEWEKNPMRKPYLEKVVLNIGVGSGGEELERAVTVLELITGKKPLKTISKTNVKEFNLRKGRPIGGKITIRGEEAEKLLKRLFIVNNNKMLQKSFDNYGNFGFGIKEHISIPGIEYEADLGIWGLDAMGRIVRPGMRVKTRRKKRSSIPKHQYVSKKEAQLFITKKFNVEIVKELELEFF